MIDQATLLTYVAIVLGFVFIPGPAVLLASARATTSGVKVGVATAAGIAVGDLVHTTMAIVGISAIIAASAMLFTAIKILGAVYLIYLGIQALRSGGETGTGAAVIRLTAGQAFRQAILAEVLNPKTAMFFLAFLPQFVQPANGAPAIQLMVLGIVFVALGLIATVAFAVCAGHVGSVMRKNPAMVRWQRRIVGSIYCALGARLAFMDR
ncbi:LysE family translocator [Acuticoccus sediminis]|uniref:LysE family translocator n=1 Tax=Acuticoccus sediminis TaxID=2184697 RepID=UPI001CFD739F|nr:LysE family translocator [Acuticoccus sediminis]